MSPLLRPLHVAMPPGGVLFAESVHAEGFRMAERVDPFHKLIYVLSGWIRYREGKGVAAAAGPGAILAVPRGVAHRIVDEKAPTLLLLCLSERFLASDADLAALWDGVSGRPERKIALGRPGRQRLEAAWRWAMAEQAAGRAGGGLGVRIAACQTLLLLGRLPRDHAGPQEAVQRVASVAREIDETFFEEWSLERGADRAGLSRRRFSELFRSTTGETLWDYVTAKRLDHAAHLLRSGGHSVLGAMFSCGFGDLSNFYRLFRGRYGQPPKKWMLQGSRRSP